MNSVDFPFSVRRDQLRREWAEAWLGWTAAGEPPQQRPRGLGAIDQELDAEILSLLPRAPYAAGFLLDGSGAGEYGHNWVEVVQAGADTLMRRVAVPNINRPNHFRPREVITDLRGLGRLCERSCARLARRGFWDLPGELGKLCLDGPGFATIWCKHGDRSRKVELRYADLPWRYWWLERFARFWLTAPVWRLRLAAWCGRLW